MSAIAGLWHFDQKPSAAEDCGRMLEAQRIYGPDRVSSRSDGPIGMGLCFKRLLPEDVYDRQPCVAAQGRKALVADVRLDNREELTERLGIAPAQAGLSSDSDILFQALLRWGADCCDDLAGDFAFAFWDADAGRLILARDHIGTRPLHYHLGRHFFAFASMPKGLHALAEIERAPDTDYAAQCMIAAMSLGPRTFFKDVCRVEPGNVAIVTKDGLTTRRYWNPQRESLGLRSADDYAMAFRHHLDRAVRARLRGASHVASHLSSGYDSSAVTATAARLLAHCGGRVTAFTSVPRENYDGPAPRGRIIDEGPLAAKTAAMYPNIEHVLVHGRQASPFENLDRYVFLFDQPVSNPCNMVWVNAIHEAARERKLCVLLTGQMGNFSISYNGYEILGELRKSGRIYSLAREAFALVRNKHMRTRAVFGATLGPITPPGLWRWAKRAFAGDDVGVLASSAVHPRRLAELEPGMHAVQPDISYRPSDDGFSLRLRALHRVDLGCFYKGMLGGWGLDYRDPTADKRLIEFCLSVPTEQFLKDGVPRALARNALAGQLPAAVLAARGNGLQGADWHEGLVVGRDQALGEIERLENCEPAAQTVDVGRLRRLMETLPSSGWERRDTVLSYRAALLRGISIGHFIRRVSGSNA
jgi:asparagine synthase (glutamine-hydrolysing)